MQGHWNFKIVRCFCRLAALVTNHHLLHNLHIKKTVSSSNVLKVAKNAATSVVANWKALYKG